MLNKIIALILVFLCAVAQAATVTIAPVNNISSGFTPSSGSDNAAMISEAVHDDDTTYNTNSATAQDLFTGADVCFTGGTTISAVVLTCWAGRPPVAGTSQAALKVVHDTTYTGTTFTVPVGTYNQFDFDVSASEAWDSTDFNGGSKIQFGYAGVSATREKRFTQCFLTVTYTGSTTACGGGGGSSTGRHRVITSQ